MKMFELIMTTSFIVIFSILGILLCYFEMKDEKERKEKIAEMRGENLN